jgi:hypothetical protein
MVVRVVVSEGGGGKAAMKIKRKWGFLAAAGIGAPVAVAAAGMRGDTRCYRADS